MKSWLPTLALLSFAVACAEPTASVSETAMTDPTASDAPAPETTETATLGAGCYWCVEAVLEQLDGVLDVNSGFMGGHVENPTYKQVCSEDTGHVEVVQVTFDPATISYEHLLAWFWRLHDPTTPNRQGNDVGPQYRSAIFYHSEEQREQAEASMKAAQGDFTSPIVTEISAASTYYVAEDYHQDYYRQNKTQGYCRAVIAPKLDKLGLEK
ncbi:MAG: peptide-methionine (S)-S-oxide reductase MsrA [Planctomycetota bacterium]